MIKKEELRPGMEVKNFMSRKTGTVEADPKNPHELRPAHEDYVRIRTIHGKQVRHTTWSLVNIMRKD